VHFYGELADKYGKTVTMRANTIGAVIKLMEANHPGQFMRGIMNGWYRVVAGASLDDVHGISFDATLAKQNLQLGAKDVHIMPVPEGSGGKWGRIILGVALIAAAFAFAPAAMGPLTAAGAASAGTGMGATAIGIGGFGISYSSIAMFGVSLILGGLSQLLTATPKVHQDSYSARESADSRPSFIFNGAVNTVEQGGPVPVIYGRMITGSVVISGGIKSENI